MALTAKTSWFSAMNAYLTRCPAADVNIRERGDSLAKYTAALPKKLPWVQEWGPRQSPVCWRGVGGSRGRGFYGTLHMLQRRDRDWPSRSGQRCKTRRRSCGPLRSPPSACQSSMTGGDRMPPEPCRCARWSWRPIARVLQFGRATGSQYLSIKYTERLAEAEIDLSVGTVGDAYDNALAECVIGLFKTEVINQCGPWKSMREVEWETLKWVDWYNNHRLLGPIGYIPPAKAEEAFYANLNTLNMVAWSLNKPPSGKPGAVQFSGIGWPQSRANRWPSSILGVLNTNGRGVLQDYHSADMWFNISDANGGKEGAASRDRTAQLMSQADVSEARRRPKVCMASNYKDCG